jgi:hypothetical protein
MRFILLSTFLISAFLIAEPLSQEDKQYIYSLPNNIASESQINDYKKFPNFKAWTIPIKDGRLYYEYANRAGKAHSQAEANSYSLAKCETRTGLDCILYFEGNNNVLKDNLRKYLSKNLVGFISQQLNVCRKYGYSGNALPECAKKNVEKIIVDFETYVDPNPRRPVQRSYNWGALGDLINSNPAFGGTPSTKICNFKNFRGQIISGDCRNNSINSGSEIYWKVR